MNLADELIAFSIDQNYGQYSCKDFDVWQKFIIQQHHLMKAYSDYIHPGYFSGFEQLPFDANVIPSLTEINQALKAVNWSAVCVDGYIPAAVYFHFIANRIFPISRHIRRLEHIEHSPTPDFIHDLIGHLPFLFIEELQHLLLKIAGLNSRSQGNELDMLLFEANLELSSLKESTVSSEKEIQDQQQRVEQIQSSLKHNPSKLTQLNRMFLWVIEFGLLGTIDDHLCFGAGILSSQTELRTVGEKRKIILPYSLGIFNYDIDFINNQNQFFVAESFKQINDALEVFEGAR